MRLPVRPDAADRRLLPEGRIAGPMPLVIAIMMFLTALAAAAGLGLAQAARELGAHLADRVTVQVIEADPRARSRQAAAAAAVLARHPGILQVAIVPDEELARLTAPWLGDVTDGEEPLPLPALIDATLAPGADRAALAPLVARVAPAARVDDGGAALAPLGRLIAALRWLATLLVLLMTAATAFTVVLAARAALNTHRATIDVLHLLGATDVQIARLFQRRLALDALFGGVLGLGVAILVLALLGERAAALGSELAGSVALGRGDWAVLLLLPVAAALLATLSARLTVIAALRRIL